MNSPPDPMPGGAIPVRFEAPNRVAQRLEAGPSPDGLRQEGYRPMLPTGTLCGAI